MLFRSLALQFGLMALVPLLALPPAHRVPRRAVWQMVGLYGVAKGLEWADRGIDHASGHWVAGHALKHLMAAVALWLMVRPLPEVRLPPRAGREPGHGGPEAPPRANDGQATG